MGHVLGTEKGNFLIRGRGRPTVYGGRASGILSIPAQEVSLGSPRVGTIDLQSPTPRTPPLQAFLADQQAMEQEQLWAEVCFQGSLRALGCCIDGVCGAGDYPTSDLSQRESEDRSASEKSK